VGHTVILAESAGNAPQGPSADGAADPANERAPVPHPPERSWPGKLFRALVVGLAFGAGWVLAGGRSGHREKEALPPETGWAGRDPAAVMVTVEPVAFRPVQRTVEGVGTLYGFEELALAARVEGRVRALRFDVADRVKPGELLLEVDPTDYELAVEQAERALQVELAKLGLEEAPGPGIDLANVPPVVLARTRLDNARARYERVRKLSATRAISEEESDNAASDFRAAQAEYANQILLARSGLATARMKQTALAVARQQLDDTRVRVPTPTRPVPGAADGVTYAVTHRAVAEGTLVQPGAEVGRLAITQTLKLRVPVPERHSTAIRLSQPAEVHTAAFPRPFAGTVTRISPAVEPTTRTFEVEVQVPNPGGALKPGSFAKAAILTRADAEAATVPLSALVNFAGITKVFLAENGRAREVQVTPGVQTTEWVEIASPALPRGAQVVTSGQTALADQTTVAVRAAAGPAPANPRQELP
jgi:RND family efflux transporter MFP subunit